MPHLYIGGESTRPADMGLRGPRGLQRPLRFNAIAPYKKFRNVLCSRNNQVDPAAARTDSRQNVVGEGVHSIQKVRSGGSSMP
ncbi:hypothetical protein [Actinobaculum sp. 313]|uniref:hypothetical protein n=1 Tax=Actinobaculum sp. 313 TaxID=2495645 RepID=UPI001F0C5DE7|nr:hypothetical protein [Actinobaculum sp. 313]